MCTESDPKSDLLGKKEIKVIKDDQEVQSWTESQYKLKISNGLPQMTVDDEKQANILKLIFKKNFQNDQLNSNKVFIL